MKRIILALLLLGAGNAWGDDNPACSDLAYDYRAHPPAELRAIAASCDDPAWARLNYNRAYHLELLQEARTLQRLQLLHDRERAGSQLEAHRLYLAMVEAMAAQFGRHDIHMVEMLNGVYDRQDEIAWHRLKGREQQARELEKG